MVIALFHMPYRKNICGPFYLDQYQNYMQLFGTVLTEWLHERTEHLDIFLFPPITHWCSISDLLFTGGRGVSDFSVLKYY